MKTELSSYIKIFSQSLDSSLCEQTVQQLKTIDKKDWEPHEFRYHTTVPQTHKDDLEVIHLGEKISTQPLIMKKLWPLIHTYIKELEFKWFNSWVGYSPIRFNRYKKNKLMAQHCDHISTLFDGERKGIPILSIIGLLNNNFTGGDLVMLNDYKVNLKAGDVMLFPSSFLYPHYVKPIKTGTRYTFVSWVW